MRNVRYFAVAAGLLLLAGAAAYGQGVPGGEWAELEESMKEMSEEIDAAVRKARFRMRLLLVFYLVTTTALVVFGAVGLVVLIRLKDQMCMAYEEQKVRAHEDAKMLAQIARAVSSTNQAERLDFPETGRFRIRGVDKSGRTITGTIAAESQMDARRKSEAKGLQSVEVLGIAE